MKPDREQSLARWLLSIQLETLPAVRARRDELAAELADAEQTIRALENFSREVFRLTRPTE